MLAVTYKNEAGEKVVHPLEAGQVFGVGRGADAPVRIRHASVSRAHAEFYEADDGNWCVRDVGSSNHTFLNGDQIEVTYIQEGDVIRFGDFSVRVETVPDPVKSGGRRSRAEPEAAPPPAAEEPRRARASSVPETAARRSRPSSHDDAAASRRGAPADAEDLRRAAPERRAPVGAPVDLSDLRRAEDRANKIDDQLRDQRSKYEEALRRIEDLEARDARHDEELREWQDRYDKAREQTDHVQDLLERAREEIKEHEETIDSFEKEVAELDSQLKQFEASREDTADTLTELKSKAVQKDRRIDELQRELDMMEFDLRNAREELESVQNSMNFENTETRKLERELALLREVIHEKENHVKSLQIEIEDRDKEIYDLKLGTGVKDLQQAKTEMMEKYFAKDKETNELREKLAKVEQELKSVRGDLEDALEKQAEAKDIGSHPEMRRKDRELTRLQSDLDASRDEIDRLQEKLQNFSPEVKAKLESEISTLRKKNQQLEDKLEETQASASGKNEIDVELAAAKRKITSLEARLEEAEKELTAAKKEARSAAAAASASSSDDAADKAKIRELDNQLADLQKDLRRAKADAEKWRDEAEQAAKAPPPPAKEVSFDKDGALDALDNINDLFRSWMSNLGVLKTYGEDIQKGKSDAKKVNDAAEGIRETLTSIEADAEDMRGELKGLRGAIEKG